MSAANYCPFERAIQTVHFSCRQSRKTYVGEKEGVICTNLAARQDCVALVSKLKKNARFALKMTKTTPVLTHGQEMKLKCGGLKGLQQQLVDPVEYNDIHELISACLDQYESVENFPYEQVMRVVAEYRLRG